MLLQKLVTMFEPTNEQGTIVAFSSQAALAGWEFIEISASFPDALLRKNDQEWRVEFEYRASAFLDHGHDHRECDLIICWENDYDGSSLPILALNDPAWTDLSPMRSDPKDVEIEYWQIRSRRAERSLSLLRKSLTGDGEEAMQRVDHTDGLDDMDMRILEAIRNGANTPYTIAKETGITLTTLKRRNGDRMTGRLPKLAAAGYIHNLSGDDPSEYRLAGE